MQHLSLAHVICVDQKAQTTYPTSSTSIIPFSSVASTVATTAKKADKRIRARAIIMVAVFEFGKNEACCMMPRGRSCDVRQKVTATSGQNEKPSLFGTRERRRPRISSPHPTPNYGS